MRRRFGRRRRRSGEPRGAPIEAHWLEKISTGEVASVSSLEQIRLEDVPDSFALTALGRGPAEEKCLVGFSPRSGGDALLAVLVATARDAGGAAARALAISPVWDALSRRRLGALGATPVPIKAVMLAPVGSTEVAIEREPVFAVAAIRPQRVADHLTRPADRLLFERALHALQGLAAKHGGAVRGYGRTVELVLLAQRVAVLRADGELALEVLSASPTSFHLAEGALPEVLDQLERLIRKRLNDKRIRDGEAGLRSRLISTFAEAARLRNVLRWPLGGAEQDSIDLVGIAEDGRPVVAAARRRLGIEGVAQILDGALSLETALPALLEGAEAPVQLAAPRLLFAAEEIDGAAECVLGHLALETRCFLVESKYSGLVLREREIAKRAPALEKQVAPTGRGGEDERVEAPEAAEPDRGAEREVQRRSRGSRGRRRSEGRGAARASAESDENVVAESGELRFEEISLFDLDDEEPESSEAEPEGTVRRRGRGRSRGRGRGQTRRTQQDSGSDGGEEPESEDEAARTASEEDRAAGSERGQGRSRGGRRGRGSGRESRENDELDLVADPDDTDNLLQLSPDAPDFEDEVEPVYDDDDLDEEPLTEQDRLRREREKRRLARHAEPVAPPPAEPGPEPEEVRRPPRGRAVILAHADRSSILAAVLLARDVRQLEGFWVYPQSELMTFFRGVATDLRENTPIFVVGFSATPARDALHAASLYRDRLVWFDHHVWPPEDLGGMKEAIGEAMLHVEDGSQSSLPAVLAYCTRRSRFSDKLVDLATGRFTQHDFERWGRLWWWRLGELAGRPGEHKADIEPLLAGRPSDLAKEAARVPAPPAPEELDFVSGRDFRLVHFGDFGIAIGAVPAELNLHLASRILRERYQVTVSLVHVEGEELFVLGSDDVAGRRAIDVGAMADHLSQKFQWIDSQSDADHVARFRIRDLGANPDRLDEVVREIGLGRAILEG